MELNDLIGARILLQAVETGSGREYEIVKVGKPDPAPAHTFTLWNQRDPRWASVKLGNSPTITIGTDGCVICSIAGMLNMMPVEANNRLKIAGAFPAGSAMLSVANAPYEKAFGGRLKHVYQSPMFWRDVPTDEMAKLKAHTDKGQPAIVLVDSGRQDGLQTHYMLCDRYYNSSVYGRGPQVYDSWFNEIEPVTKRYSKALGYSPIYRFDLFEVV